MKIPNPPVREDEAARLIDVLPQFTEEPVVRPTSVRAGQKDIASIRPVANCDSVALRDEPKIVGEIPSITLGCVRADPRAVRATPGKIDSNAFDDEVSLLEILLAG